MLDVAVCELKDAVLYLIGLDVVEISGNHAVLIFELDAGEDACTLVIDFEGVEVRIDVEYLTFGESDFYAVGAVSFGDLNLLVSENVTMDWKLRRIVASSLTFMMPSMMTDLTVSELGISFFLKISRVHTAVKTITARTKIIVTVKIFAPPFED